MKKNALIGFSGFVGGTLLKQASFNFIYRSTNIQEIDGQEFDFIICAGASAQKWIANKNPDEDIKNILSLISHLKNIKCNNFVLISTVDVFKVPVGVNESTPVEEKGLHAYGLHRRLLEKFVQEHFSKHLIVRIPGLVGPNLRKNLIFDFLNDNNLHLIESRGVFQFYPMVNFWYDIQLALQKDIQLLHLTAEPISVADISLQGFGRPFIQEFSNSPAIYDMQTLHADLFGVRSRYQYSVRETIQAIRSYAQSEPITLSPKLGDVS